MTPDPVPDPDLDAHRPYLAKLAYRMLGSVSDAEEVAQESFVRWLAAGRPQVDSLRAWLTTTATRLCLDRLKSAPRQRERRFGDDLPEPFVETPADRAELDDTLSMALLVTIRRLRPQERAVFLLHDVFGYAFDEVAATLGLTPANCRQLAVRARGHLQVDRPRSDATPETVERLTDAFFAAVRSGEPAALVAVLSADVVFRSDGGGKVPATARPIRGRDRVTAFLLGVLAGPRADPGLTVRRLWFNGAPGAVVTDVQGQPVTAFHFFVQDQRILGIYAQRDPDKLRRLFAR